MPGKFAIAGLSILLTAGSALAAPPVAHGMRIFSILNETVDVGIDGKHVAHLPPSAAITINMTLGEHKLLVRGATGDDTAGLSLDDTDVVDWHGAKYWCLLLGGDGDDVKIKLSSPATCKKLLGK